MSEPIETVREYDDYLRSLGADPERQAECGWDHSAVCANCRFDAAGPERATITRLTAQRDSLAASLEEARRQATETDAYASRCLVARNEKHEEVKALTAELSELRARVSKDGLDALIDRIMPPAGSGWNYFREPTQEQMKARDHDRLILHTLRDASLAILSPPEAPTDKGETP